MRSFAFRLARSLRRVYGDEQKGGLVKGTIVPGNGANFNRRRLR
jgi:hypothetical protein